MSKLIANITHFIHSRFIWLLVASYILAGLLPQFGLAIRHLSLGHVTWTDGSAVNFSLSMLMLSFLLFNAGLGINTKELFGMLKRPGVLVAGFLANMLVPIVLVLVLRGLMALWHNSDELQNLLVGLALIVAMPIAGSSTAWSQNANGNLSLSLGLVFFSTILSPITTPLVLHAFGYLTAGDYSTDLHELATQGTNAFMSLTVVIPSVLGIIAHYVLGEKKTQAIKPVLKLINFIDLLLLNYSNATTALPQVFKQPDWDFLAFIIGTTVGLCLAAFAAGWLIAKAFKTDQSSKAALMFGLGMNNNGTGLVLAAAALADHPAVMLPMIFYTLVQQLIAALVDWRVFKAED